MAWTVTCTPSDTTLFKNQVVDVIVTITGSGSTTAYSTALHLLANGSLITLKSAVSSGGAPSGVTYTTSWQASGAPTTGQTWSVKLSIQTPPGIVGNWALSARAVVSYNAGVVGGGGSSSTTPDIVTASGGTITTYDQVMPTAVPTAPSGLTANAGVVNFSIGLAWTDNSTNEDGFEIYRSTTSGSGFTKLATVGAGVVGYDDQNLPASTLYYYKVCAINQIGPSAFTSEASATTRLPPVAPAAPASMTATALSANNVYLTWTCAATNETEIRVYRHTVSGGPYTLLATLPANSTAWTDATAAASTTYYYVTTAYNPGGASAYSNEATVTTPIQVVTVAPVSGFTLTPTANTGIKQVAGRLLISSDLDRMKVFCNKKWFEAGLKRQRTAPTISAVGTVNQFPSGLGGVNADATATAANYAVYITLFSSDRVTRSKPGPVSATLALQGQKIKVIPPGDAGLTVSAATNATPIQITTTANHGLVTGDDAIIAGVVGNTAANGVWTITKVDATKFTLDTSIGNSAYTSGGTVSTKVNCRDIAYDSNGTQIDAADYWEIYLQCVDLMDKPVRVALLPLSTLSWTSSATLSLTGLVDGTHRPMEMLSESELPPACAHIDYFENRVQLFGERTIKPSSTELTAGAALAITNGQTTFTVSNYTLTDAILHKELFINESGTGWYIRDVISSSQAEIYHADTDINAGGFNGITSAAYSNFAFAGKPSRKYRSAFFSGEILGGLTFSPETFPPTNVQESEYDPDDDQDPIASVASRDVLFVFKRGKAFIESGGMAVDGDESGMSFPVVRPISRSTGLLAPYSICRDSSDVVYGICDKGLVAFGQEGIRELSAQSGNAFQMQRTFDINTADLAVGAFLPRHNWIVQARLTRKGATTAGLDGFGYSIATGYFFPFTTQAEITCLLPCQTIDGDFQLLAGDAMGRIGVLFAKGLYTDEVNFMSATPYTGEVGLPCYVTSGIIASTHAIKPRLCRPHIKQDPLTTAVTCTVAFDNKNRMSTPGSFASDVSSTFSTGTRYDHVSFAPIRMQSALMKFSFTSSRSERLDWNGMELEADICGSS